MTKQQLINKLTEHGLNGLDLIGLEELIDAFEKQTRTDTINEILEILPEYHKCPKCGKIQDKEDENEMMNPKCFKCNTQLWEYDIHDNVLLGEIKQLITNFIKDVTKVGSIPKSEVRERKEILIY